MAAELPAVFAWTLAAVRVSRAQRAGIIVDCMVMEAAGNSKQESQYYSCGYSFYNYSYYK